MYILMYDLVCFFGRISTSHVYLPVMRPNLLYRLPRKQRDCELGIDVSQAHVALRAHRVPDELGGPCGVGLPLDQLLVV